MADSTPLIALSIVGKLGLLRDMFNEVMVPSSVFQEVVESGKGKIGSKEVSEASWIKVMNPEGRGEIPPILAGLDRGELDVILLAREVKADLVLIDEKAGRKVAKALGLKVKGTLGLLLFACKKGFMEAEEAEEVLTKLNNSSIRISNRLMTWFREQLSYLKRG